MKIRDLRLVQEPAMNYWLVYDHNDPEDGYFFGPEPRKAEAQAFLDGYLFSQGELNETTGS